MRKISLLDELGFIPYKKENIHAFERRCEEILSLEDKLHEIFRDKLPDSTDAAKVLYTHYKVKPKWIPVIKAGWLEGRVKKRKLEHIKIPIVYVPTDELSFKVHELAHAFREPIYELPTWKKHLLYTPREVLEDEYMASYPCIKEGLRTKFYSFYPKIFLSVKVIIGSAVGLYFFYHSFSSFFPLCLDLYIGGRLTQEAVSSLLSLRRVEKLPNYIKEIERVTREKTGYLIARLRTSEIENFAKELRNGKKLEELLYNIPGLRGEIIRYRY